DGRLTDGHGRTVNFRNTVLIMTSNLGSDHLTRATIGYGLGAKEEAAEDRENRSEVLGEVRRFFRPEFFNRLDEIVVFGALAPEELLAIVDLQLALLAKTVAARGLSLDVSKAAREALARDG
ncbi:MAG: AAA family ATPase, partial [bacterium]